MTTHTTPRAPITAVTARERVAVARSYHRVPGANVLIYEPSSRAAGADDLLLVSMHGGLNPTLEHSFLETVASYGVPTAYCVPDKSSFIDQFRAMDRCMTLFRERAGTVVLMGQSRGAAVMSGYQNIAENGASGFQGADRRLAIPDLVLQPADGLLLLDANFGTTLMHVMSLNPALVAEWSATAVDPLFDATNPENGYAPDGGARFAEGFRRKFLAAQRRRYEALLDEASRRWSAIQAGTGSYTDNEPFIVPDAIGINNSPKLFAGDLRYFSRTRSAWPLIHRDGSITDEVVPCVRVDENNPGIAGTLGGAFTTTVQDYLWSEVRLTDDYDYGDDYLDGVDFASSFTCSSGNVASIHVPLLLMGHTAGYEFIAAEWSMERAASDDRTIAFMEGATHGWTSIDAEVYGDTLDIEARYVIQWVTATGRFDEARGGSIALGGDPALGPTLSDDARQALRDQLVGHWSGVTPAESARFSAGGSSELGFAVALTRFEMLDDGSLRFFDRYGAATTYRLADSDSEALADPACYRVTGDRLVFGGVPLDRARP